MFTTNRNPEDIYCPAPSASITYKMSRHEDWIQHQVFTLPYSDAAVEDLRSRLARTRWPDEIPGSGWEYGVDLEFMRQLCDYWKDQFDWKAQIQKLSAFHHYRCNVGWRRRFTSFTNAARDRRPSH